MRGFLGGMRLCGFFDSCSNVVFGGPKRNYLYICATTSIYGVRLHVNGQKTF